MLKNKCCLYVIISIRFFSITICNLLIEFLSYISDQSQVVFVAQGKMVLITDQFQFRQHEFNNPHNQAARRYK